MKNVYKAPTLTVVRVSAADFLSTSGNGDCYVEDPYDDEYGEIFT